MLNGFNFPLDKERGKDNFVKIIRRKKVQGTSSICKFLIRLFRWLWLSSGFVQEEVWPLARGSVALK